MHISENIVVQLELYFELVEPISIPKDRKNSNSVTLEVDDKNMMTAFKIKSGSSDEEQRGAIHKANRFVNYLSFQTGLYVSHKHPKKGNSKGPKIKNFSIGSLITNLRRLDLSDANLIDVISNTSSDSLQLAHFASGQRAMEIKNWPEAIREFYLVIENESEDKSIDKYRFLRNAISHTKLDDKRGNRATVLKNEFDLNLEIDGSLDITNPEILNKLEDPAKSLRRVSLQHINKAESIKNIQN